MQFLHLVWQEIRQRPTAMLTGLLTILLGTGHMFCMASHQMLAGRIL